MSRGLGQLQREIIGTRSTSQSATSGDGALQSRRFLCRNPVNVGAVALTGCVGAHTRSGKSGLPNFRV
jgi:hypothetical protein